MPPLPLHSHPAMGNWDFSGDEALFFLVTGVLGVALLVQESSTPPQEDLAQNHLSPIEVFM